jgi:hypothetical protein
MQKYPICKNNILNNSIQSQLIFGVQKPIKANAVFGPPNGVDCSIFAVKAS